MKPSDSAMRSLKVGFELRSPAIASITFRPRGSLYNVQFLTNHQPAMTEVITRTTALHFTKVMRERWRTATMVILVTARGRRPRALNFERAAKPMTAPSATRHRIDAPFFTMRVISNKAREERGITKLSLFTEPAMKRNMGLKATIAAAPAATSLAPGTISRLIKYV
ncbi:MAG: hypothetical protein V3T92_00665, partial [Anaerolineae bacterium]